MNKYEKARAQVYNDKATNESLTVITELVERATPTKTIYETPKNSRNNMKFHYCPNCKKHTGLSRYPYCSTCGQALEYSNNE